MWDLSAPAQPVLSVEPPDFASSVASGPDGNLLYVGSHDRPSVTVYDVATGRRLRSEGMPGEHLVISPDGTTLAAARGNDIVLLDSATLAERSAWKATPSQCR